MSKKAGATLNRDKSKAGTSGAAEARPAPAASVFRPPFAPRPGLFYGLLGVLTIWVGVLLTMYLITVYPQHDRHFIPTGPALPYVPPTTAP